MAQGWQWSSQITDKEIRPNCISVLHRILKKITESALSNLLDIAKDFEICGNNKNSKISVENKTFLFKLKNHCDMALLTVSSSSILCIQSTKHYKCRYRDMGAASKHSSS